MENHTILRTVGAFATSPVARHPRLGALPAPRAREAVRPTNTTTGAVSCNPSNTAPPSRTLILIAVIVTAMTLPCKPSVAQGDHWSITYTRNGTTTYQPSVGNTVTYAWNKGVQMPYLFVAPLSVSMAAEGTIAATLKWVDSAGNPAANPPSRVVVKASVVAGWQATASASDAPYLSGTGNANDGLGDTYALYDPGYGCGGRSMGSHLFIMDGSTGTATLSAHLTQNASVNYNVGATASAGMNPLASFAVALDDRYVTVSTSLGLTHRCSGGPNHTAVPQTVTSDGIVYAHTAKVIEGTPDRTITFTALPAGSWSPDSGYHWYSAAKVHSYDGQFTLPNDPIEVLTNIYPASDFYNGSSHVVSPWPAVDPFVTTSYVERVHIRLTDAQDAADAFGCAYVEFHEPFEDWDRDPAQEVYHPAPAQPSPSSYGEWNDLGPLPNCTDVAMQNTYTVSDQISTTVEGTIGSTNGITAGPKEVQYAYSENESITIGQTVTSSSSESFTFTIPAHTKLYRYWGPGWKEIGGETCYYAAQGFVGRCQFHAHVPLLAPGGSLNIQFASYPQPY